MGYHDIIAQDLIALFCAQRHKCKKKTQKTCSSTASSLCSFFCRPWKLLFFVRCRAGPQRDTSNNQQHGFFLTAHQPKNKTERGEWEVEKITYPVFPPSLPPSPPSMELKLHPFMNILAFDSANPDGRRQLVALCRPPRPPGSRLIPLKYGWKGETERGGGVSKNEEQHSQTSQK